MITPVMPVYARDEIVIERGEGCWLFDTQGHRYLDFAAGVAVNSLGHGHSHLVEALQRQAATLWHCSNLYRIPQQEEAARRLVKMTFADTVFFTNSGSESIECALKMVRKYHDDTGYPERFRVITCENAFHGRTMATIAAGGQTKLVQGFEPVVDGFDHVPLNNLDALRAAITPETAAIMVESLQGEGGFHMASADYLYGIRETCDEFGLLMVIDEIQCGMGRTGKLFAYEWSGIMPDIIAVGKGIGGGFPVGACLATEKAAIGMVAGTHGSTYGGNPLAMAVVNALLDVISVSGFLERIIFISNIFDAELNTLASTYCDKIAELRGIGLMRGIKCAEKVESKALISKLRSIGLLSVPAADNVIRLLPPLIVNEEEIETALAMLDQVFREVSYD